MIPLIIHQIWWQGETEVPEKYRALQKTWQEHHLHWQYMFWDETKITKFMQKESGDFFRKWKKYPLMIQKIDAAKYYILDVFGGFYVDMDMRCLKNLDILAKSKAFVAGSYMFNFFVNNGIIGSVPRHKIWKNVKQALKKHFSPKWYHVDPVFHVLDSTGPFFFTSCVNHAFKKQEDDEKQNDFFIGYPEMFEPLGKPTEFSFAVHEHGYSWLENGWTPVLFYVVIALLLVALVSFMLYKGFTSW